MSMIKWVVTNSAAYAKLGLKERNALYFLEDTQEIFKGDISFTQSIVMVNGNQFPQKGAQGKIYINSTNLEGKVWVDNAWKTVIEPIATELTDDRSEKKAVSGDAIKTYVKQKVSEAVTGKFVEGIDYDRTSKELSYIKNGQTNKIELAGFVTGADYSKDTGDLSFTVQGGETIKINIPKDNFVQSGEYNKDSNEIILTLANGQKVVIPAADLVDINDYESTNTVELKATEGKVSANVIVSKAEGNKLQSTEAGLFVEATDISGKLDKVTEGRADEIIIANANGTVTTSGKKVGGATLTTSDANTLATEAAVSAIKTALQQSIDKKFNTEDVVGTVRDVENASETKVASERAVSVAINKLTTNKIDKASITERLPEADASIHKVASEAAVVAALSWFTLD